MSDDRAPKAESLPLDAAAYAEATDADLDRRIISALRDLGPMPLPDVCAVTGLRRYVVSERLLVLRSLGRVSPAWDRGLDSWQALDRGAA